jgi:hypothetical protein
MIILDEKNKSFVEEKFNEIRQGKSNGKFKYLLLIFSETELLSFKPSMLREMLLLNYDVKAENVGFRSFYRWISNYRKGIKLKDNNRYNTTASPADTEKNKADSDSPFIYKKGIKTPIIDVSKEKPKNNFIELVI